MNAVVAFALKQRVLMVALMLFVFGVGFISFIKLNIEAYPDPVPPRVEVITQNPGASAEEIERYITIPIEIQMTGIPPRSTRIRTISLFGLSDVRVAVHLRLYLRRGPAMGHQSAEPSAAAAQWRDTIRSPRTSPIGEIYRYRIVGPPGY